MGYYRSMDNRELVLPADKQDTALAAINAAYGSEYTSLDDAFAGVGFDLIGDADGNIIGVDNQSNKVGYTQTEEETEFFEVIAPFVERGVIDFTDEPGDASDGAIYRYVFANGKLLTGYAEVSVKWPKELDVV